MKIQKRLQKIIGGLIVALGAISMSSCSSKESSTFDSNKNLDYLLTIESSDVKNFVNKENKLSLDRLKADPLFAQIEKEISDIVTAKDKLPGIYMMDNRIYQFWQDEQHVRGVLQRQSISDFNSQKKTWEIVLDIDQLATTEKKNWVWKGHQCFTTKSNMCLIYLSNGGKDATVAREFDLNTKSFVENGFIFPESKSNFTWIDENTLFWADGSEIAAVTDSGYPRQLKTIKRNQKITEAQKIDEISKDKIWLGTSSILTNNKTYFFITYGLTFYTSEIFWVKSISEPTKKIKIPIPSDADFLTVFNDQLVFAVKSEFSTAGTTYPPGSVLSYDINTSENKLHKFIPFFVPTQKEIFQSLAVTENTLWVQTLNDVKENLLIARFDKKNWLIKPFNSKLKNVKTGSWSVVTSDEKTKDLYLSYTDFLTPTSYYFTSEKAEKLKLIIQSPERFIANDLVSEQNFVKSKDGTKIPYFIVHKKNMVLDGKNPTYLHGYGGFEVSLTPHYLATLGKSWLSRGGVYVIANIRGGGEYGPKWHKAALRENRQKAYDDFIAVAEDLIQKKITSTKNLGIVGGSNGGLLMSVMLTQRPDLFNAIVAEVPLANMLKFHKLLAGASWVAEYGDPEVKTDRDFILKYSPVQNLRPEVKYPEAFFITSTKDDRVHPGHARQMVARLRELGQPVVYFENPDGGHGRAANLKEYSMVQGLELTYLFQKLNNR